MGLLATELSTLLEAISKAIDLYYNHSHKYQSIAFPAIVTDTPVSEYQGHIFSHTVSLSNVQALKHHGK